MGIEQTLHQLDPTRVQAVVAYYDAHPLPASAEALFAVYTHFGLDEARRAEFGDADNFENAYVYAGREYMLNALVLAAASVGSWDLGEAPWDRFGGLYKFVPELKSLQHLFFRQPLGLPAHFDPGEAGLVAIAKAAEVERVAALLEPWGEEAIRARLVERSAPLLDALVGRGDLGRRLAEDLEFWRPVRQVREAALGAAARGHWLGVMEK